VPLNPAVAHRPRRQLAQSDGCKATSVPHPPQSNRARAPEVEMANRHSTCSVQYQCVRKAVHNTTERRNTTHATALPSDGAYTLGRRGRHWEIRNKAGALVCLTVYKCGAREVIRRLSV